MGGKLPAKASSHQSAPPTCTHTLSAHAQPPLAQPVIPRPSDRKGLRALPALPWPGGCLVMSWVQASPVVRGGGEEGEVFDEEADESLLVQREWRSQMQRRVKVKLRGGRRVPAAPGCGERGAGL